MPYKFRIGDMETNLIAWQGGRTQIVQHVGDSGVAARVPALAQLPS
jgi:hypothetical protein